MFRAICLNLLFCLVALFTLAQAPTEVPAQQAFTSSSTTNLIGDALAAYRKRDFDGAIAKYREFGKEHPHSPDMYAGMIRVYLKQKKVEEAARVAQEGLSNTSSPRLRVAQAEIWFRQGRIIDAENEWVKVINSGYPEARAYLGVARVRNAIAMYKTAKTMIDKAYALDPGDPDIREEWIDSLSRRERIHYLKDSLAGENNWSDDERSDISNYLKFLEERSKQKRSPCRLVSKVKATETPMVNLLEDPRHLRGFGLAVFLNGHKSSLMLDTGASGILVRRGVAERAGISKITETKVTGIGKKGRRDAYIGVADSIKIGELEFQNCPVEVMESRSVAGEEGLIGTDVFEDFLVELDLPNVKMKLSELPRRPGESERELALKSEDDDDDSEDAEAKTPESDAKAGETSSGQVKSAEAKTGDAKSGEGKPAEKKPAYAGPQDRYIASEMQKFTRVFRFGHDLLIPTTIGNVPSKLFLLDTGALTNFISPAAAREVTKIHGDSDMIVEGISGRMDKVYSADKAVLQFGHLKQENQDMTAFDTTGISDNTGTEVSGFLGFTTLRMLDIKIDYRDALVDFELDPRLKH